ncbi:reverse transcriptase domain-containing protein [Tanacetum coccineum]
MTQAAIKKLVANSVFAALEAQAANMANTDNTTRPREAPVARKCSYKEFISCQPINCKKLLIKKYCPRTEVQKMEDEFYHLTVKGNDLKAYVRRFQELATLCPTMVPDSEKMMEVFIGGLPRSIEGNVTASKPQTLEEAINIAQRLMDQVTKHTPVQVSSDHKQKFDDRRTFNNNNYHNIFYTKQTATISTTQTNKKYRKPSGPSSTNHHYLFMLSLQLKTIGPATGSNLLPVTVTCHAYRIVIVILEILEQITKKRTKNKAKTTKPDSEWKRL